MIAHCVTGCAATSRSPRKVLCSRKGGGDKGVRSVRSPCLGPSPMSRKPSRCKAVRSIGKCLHNLLWQTLTGFFSCIGRYSFRYVWRVRLRRVTCLKSWRVGVSLCSFCATLVQVVEKPFFVERIGGDRCAEYRPRVVRVSCVVCGKSGRHSGPRKIRQDFRECSTLAVAQDYVRQQSFALCMKRTGNMSLFA